MLRFNPSGAGITPHVTLTAAPLISAGTYTITFSGQTPDQTHSANWTVIVADKWYQSHTPLLTR